MPAIAERRPALLVALAAAALLLPAAARGGGMEIGDNGGEAMGRGGAFVAKADSPAALNYNPAGFAKLRGHQVVITANALYSTLDFQRSGERLPAADGAGGAYPLVRNGKPWFVVPMHFVLTTDLGFFDRLTLAAGLYGPSVAAAEFGASAGDQPAPQRFDKVSTSGLILFPSLGIAYRLHRMLDIGVTFQWAVTRVQSRTLATVGSACSQAEDPACDVVMDVEAEDLFAPTGSLGLLFRPARNLELGSLLRFPSSAVLDGRARVSFGPKVKELESYFRYQMLDPEEPRISLTSSFPWMFRLGARYVWWNGLEEKGDLELDFTYEAWSQASKRSVQIDATSLNRPLPAMDIDWKLADTFGVRAGGAYNLRLARDLRIIARLGAFAETQSTRISDTSLQVFAAPRLGLTAGLGLKWRGLGLDLAYAHVFLSERQVNHSTVRARDFGGGEGPVVGNGSYRATLDGLYLQLTGSYGAERRRPRRPIGEAEQLARRQPADPPRPPSPADAAEAFGDAPGVGAGIDERDRARRASQPRIEQRATSSREEVAGFAGHSASLGQGSVTARFRGERRRLSRPPLGHRRQAGSRVARPRGPPRLELREQVVKHCPRRDRMGRCVRARPSPGASRPTSSPSCWYAQRYMPALQVKPRAAR